MSIRNHNEFFGSLSTLVRPRPTCEMTVLRILVTHTCPSEDLGRQDTDTIMVGPPLILSPTPVYRFTVRWALDSSFSSCGIILLVQDSRGGFWAAL
mmetsp:Transcript_38676/g.57521  ORF Transcript_38676/g.57521 Transcript_38676/m.57521 type:complete len:96 (+) Transcript_38676:1217-1504(+)